MLRLSSFLASLLMLMLYVPQELSAEFQQRWENSHSQWPYSWVVAIFVVDSFTTSAGSWQPLLASKGIPYKLLTLLPTNLFILSTSITELRLLEVIVADLNFLDDFEVDQESYPVGRIVLAPELDGKAGQDDLALLEVRNSIIDLFLLIFFMITWLITDFRASLLSDR